VLLGDRGWRLLSPDRLGHQIRKSVGLDRHLGYLGYVKPLELKSPLGDPTRGEMVPDDFAEPK
jgi:hypothetical protein